MDTRPCLLRLPITPKQALDAEYVIDLMDACAESGEADYAPSDVPWLDGEALKFSFQPDAPVDGVVDDLIERLETSVDPGSRLNLLLRRVFHRPNEQIREETRLRGAHVDLVRQGIFRGLNLTVLAASFWKLQAMRAEGPLPTIHWRACNRSGTGGRAHVYQHHPRVTMSIGVDGTIEGAVEVLLHELVHCACPIKEHHGELFCRRLIACAREAFGLDLDTAALLGLPPGRAGKRAYAIDDIITKALKGSDVIERLRADPTTSFELAAPETEDQIATKRKASTAARVAANEAHARATLAAWERKQKSAQKRVTKWRGKVRYYERRQEAAKRTTKEGD